MARSYDGTVTTIAFYAKDQKTSKTGFTWDESNIWTVLQQYAIPRSPSHEYYGVEYFAHGDFEAVLTPVNHESFRNSSYKGSLTLMSESLEKFEKDATKKAASELIPDGLKKQFDVTVTQVVREDSLVSVSGSVKNNSSVAVVPVEVKVSVYAVDDKQHVIFTGDGSLEPVSAERFIKPKLRSLNPRPRARRRPRPRSVGVFCSEESPIVRQLFCPVILSFKHSRGRRTTTSTRTSPQFRSLG